MALLPHRERPSGKRLNRKPGHTERKAAHDEWLRSMGIDPNKKPTRKREKLNLSSSPTKNVTSDTIPGNGSKKDSITYTGNEIAGIVTTHKSNLMPIRKDNKQAAIDASQMRRN